MKEHTQLSLLFSLHDTANYFSFNLVILCLCISCFHHITYFPLSILINNTKYAFSNITLTFKERKFEGKLGSFIYCLKKFYHRSKGVKAILANTWLRIILCSVLMLSHTCLNWLEYIDCWGLKNKQTNKRTKIRGKWKVYHLVPEKENASELHLLIICTNTCIHATPSQWWSNFFGHMLVACHY